MVSNLPTLNPQIMEVAAPSGKGLWGYYRKRNGWIIQGPTTPTNRSDMEYMGHTFLPQYGQFQLGTREATSQPKAIDANGVPWNPAMESWRLIFQRGGAREFPIDQIVAYQWHIRPPYREVTFPQMQDVEVFDIPCPECDRVFCSTARRDVAHQLRQHLTTKVDTRHSYTVNDLKELGHEWEIDFETSRVGVKKRELRQVPETVLTPTGTTVPELTPTSDVLVLLGAQDDARDEPTEVARNDNFSCPDGCGWTPPLTSRNPKAAVGMHRWRKHRAHGVSK